MSRKILPGILIAAILLLGAAVWTAVTYRTDQDESSTAESGLLDEDEKAPVPKPVGVNPREIAAQPRETGALGGYDVLIADRGNNRILEVTPEKNIIWVYQFDLPKKGLGADDAFFTDGGKTVSVNLEEYGLIELIDYATKTVTWSYGKAGTYGSGSGRLHTPDDAYKLANGDVIVADISNCRVIEIAPDKRIIHQYGEPKKCSNRPGYLDKPNGDTPLPNGHILISNIVGRSLVELDERWQPVFTMKLPVRYPSDPQQTVAGNILISDYSNPGKIVEVSRQGNVVWEYRSESGVSLNKPSLAIELPNGNILSNDDMNHRVIVIDKQTRKIVWQYGVTGKPGDSPGQLNTPDGVDIILRSPEFLKNAEQQYGRLAAQTAPLKPSSIGAVTRHSAPFIGHTLLLKGYLVKRERDYLIFSDENGGPIGRYDLPVTGSGLSLVKPGRQYALEGRFLDRGLASANRNPDHFELSKPPEPVQ